MSVSIGGAAERDCPASVAIGCSSRRIIHFRQCGLDVIPERGCYIGDGGDDPTKPEPGLVFNDALADDRQPARIS